jgi:hypothetical protein
MVVRNIAYSKMHPFAFVVGGLRQVFKAHAVSMSLHVGWLHELAEG